MEDIKGRKNDIKDGKLRWDLLPLDLIELIVEVYDFGARKYAPETWKQLESGRKFYEKNGFVLRDIQDGLRYHYVRDI